MNQEIEKIKLAIPNLDEQRLRVMFMIALEALENIGTDAHDKDSMIFAPVVVENALDKMKEMQ
jgi:hypothetical protein